MVDRPYLHNSSYISILEIFQWGERIQFIDRNMYKPPRWCRKSYFTHFRQVFKYLGHLSCNHRNVYMNAVIKKLYKIKHLYSERNLKL